MKTSKIVVIAYTIFIFIILYNFYSCKPAQEITDKSNAVLWSENCQRCHNLPSPTMYNDDQWKVIVTHMQVRANITKEEADKIMEFLQAGN